MRKSRPKAALRLCRIYPFDRTPSKALPTISRTGNLQWAISCVVSIAFITQLISINWASAEETLIGLRWSRIQELENLVSAGARMRYVTSKIAIFNLDDVLETIETTALVFADTAESGESYYLVEHLHNSPAQVVYRDSVGWALIRIETERFREILEFQEFLWPLPEVYSLRGWQQLVSRKKAAEAPESLVVELLNRVDSEVLREHVLKLALLQPDQGSDTSNLRSRYAFRSELQQSTGYIRDRMEEYLGPDRVQTQVFEVDGTEMMNVIGELRGSDSSAGYYVLCAHYDAVGSRSAGWVWQTDPAPGADDNATGVALVLESARVLAEVKLPWSVRFIAFSGEEIGLWGSRAFAERAKERDEQILGVLNFDMVGYNDLSHRLQLVANPASRWLAQLLMETDERFKIGLEIELLEEANARLSDHAPFWARGFDAILGIENYLPIDSTSAAVRRGLYRVNRQYHTVADVPDSINWDLVRRSSGLAVAFIGQFAQSKGLPNLAVFPGDLWTTNDDTLRLRVSNTGLASANGDIRVALQRCALDTNNCETIYETSVRLNLDAGDARDLAVPWDRFGQSVFRLEVDVDDIVEEVSEDDNQAVQLLRRVPVVESRVFPNPFEVGKRGFVSFAGIPLRSTVKIFSVDGASIWTGREEWQGALSREVRWSGQNDAGFAVSGGTYIYTITGVDGMILQKGKLTVVR